MQAQERVKYNITSREDMKEELSFRNLFNEYTKAIRFVSDVDFLTLQDFQEVFKDQSYPKIFGDFLLYFGNINVEASMES
mmetsp:Transcript_59/g.67  ORF Transcript_59/g.67 Transcript_59/m.67 type:complete len:80 (+) Transcript_59:1383-1622(+)